MANLVTLIKKETLFGVSNSTIANFSTIFFLAFIFSCNKPTSPDAFKTAGKIVSEIRALNSFSDIDLFSNIHLNLIKDTVEYAIIKAGKNLLPKINSNVSSNILTLKNTNTFNFLRSYKDSIIVDLHYKKLKHLKYYGAGNITTIDTLREDEFSFESWYGSGHSDFKIRTNVSSFGFHTGIVDATVSGISNENRLYATEQGIIDCKKLSTKKTFCHNRGIASLYINASDEIGAEIYGEGNVYYSGIAKTNYLKTTSTGNLIYQK